jgi:hypothetical protein
MYILKLVAVVAIAGPMIYSGARRAAEQWDGRQWRRWLLRLGLVLGLAAGLILAASALWRWGEGPWRRAALPVCLALAGSGFIWGIGGVMETLFDLGEAPFPHLFGRDTIVYCALFTLILVLGGIAAEVSMWIGAPTLRGYAIAAGLVLGWLGVARPAAFWSHPQLVLFERRVGATRARMAYALIGAVLTLFGLFAPASVFGHAAT